MQTRPGAVVGPDGLADGHLAMLMCVVSVEQTEFELVNQLQRAQVLFEHRDGTLALWRGEGGTLSRRCVFWACGDDDIMEGSYVVSD